MRITENSMQKNYDVIIIGAGAIGLICAYQLAGRGMSVLVLERQDTAAGAGAGSEGVISWHTKKPGFHRQLFLRSWEAFHALADELGDIGMEWRAGSLDLAESELEMESVRSTYSAEEIPEGFSVALLDARQTLELEPNVRPDIFGALYVPDVAHVDLFKFLFSLRRAVIQRGTEVRNEMEVQSLIFRGDRVIGVRCAQEAFYADTVINCGGYLGQQVAEMAGLHMEIKPRRGQTIVCQQTRPLIFHNLYSSLYNVVKFHPELIQDEEVKKKGINFSLHQSADGSIYMTGSREFAGYDTRTENDTIRRIAQNALQRVPCLKDVLILRTFAGLRPSTADGLPMIGAVDGLEGFLMCAGHEGDGIALAPATGLIVRQMLTAGRCTLIDAAPLSPMRFL